MRKLFICISFPLLLLFFACGPGLTKEPAEKGPNDTDLIYHENFTKNVGNWLTIDDRTHRIWISEGKYHFDNHHKIDSGHFTVREKYIRTSKNFSIEAAVRFVQGVDSLTNFGLVFGHHYNLNCGFKFLISADGHFEVSEEYYGEYGVINPPTYTEFLKEGTETNYLRVNKTDSVLRFLVNGEEVYDMPFDSVYGNYVGFQVYNDIEVEFDNLKIFN